MDSTTKSLCRSTVQQRTVPSRQQSVPLPFNSDEEKLQFKKGQFGPSRKTVLFQLTFRTTSSNGNWSGPRCSTNIAKLCSLSRRDLHQERTNYQIECQAFNFAYMGKTVRLYLSRSGRSGNEGVGSVQRCRRKFSNEALPGASVSYQRLPFVCVNTLAVEQIRTMYRSFFSSLLSGVYRVLLIRLNVLAKSSRKVPWPIRLLSFSNYLSLAFSSQRRSRYCRGDVCRNRQLLLEVTLCTFKPLGKRTSSRRKTSE